MADNENAGERHPSEDGRTTAGTSDHRHSPAARHSAAEACTAADKEEVEQLYEAVQFNALRNALMHTARQRWLDSLHRCLMFLIVLSGTAGASALFIKWTGDASFAAIAAVLATLDLVLDLRPKARLHDDLKRRYYLLLADIESKPAADKATIAGWNRALMVITADEPDAHHVVDCLAYNRAALTLGREQGNLLVVRWPYRLLRHVMTFEGYNPSTRDELAAWKKLHGWRFWRR